MNELETGMVLYQKTSDEILMDLDGNTQAVNEHEEPWVVMDVMKDTYKLISLETQRTYKMYKKEFEWLLRHGRIRVGKERA